MTVELSLEIKTDDAAAQDDPQGEIVRCLRGLIDAVECGLSYAVLYDSNGNKIGECTLNITKEEE